ncbi:MAG TPA: beta-galactosidase, partial [Candidatus Cybelea sp.]
MISDTPLLAGEMHYPRIPRAYWEARLKMAYAMGLDAVSTYVFWNLHEPSPGAFDFSGENDVAEFVRTAARAGLSVVLRPGPYVCAEWDLGGLPAWLLAGEPIALRTQDEGYMRPVRRWLKRLGEELAPLQRSSGGPILAVQLENEYGAFGNSKPYLAALRDALDDAGFGASPYYTIDQPGDLERGSLPGVA